MTSNLGYTPAWSPDGEHIVFSAPGLFIMHADGSDARAFPALGVGETGPRRLDGLRAPAPNA